MWKVRHITEKQTELRLSDVGLGPVSTRAVYADGDLLVPYACLVDPSDNPVQFDVCNHCGTPGCQVGGWVALRSLGERIVLIPCFDDMQAESPDSRHDPPGCIQHRGAAVLEGAALEQARTTLNGLPQPAALPRLTLHEALLCLQLEALDGALGLSSSEPSLRKDLILACSEDDLSVLLCEFERLIARAREHNVLACPRTEASTITLYLDGPRGHSDWSPVARLPSGNLAFRLADGLFAEATTLDAA